MESKKLLVSILALLTIIGTTQSLQAMIRKSIAKIEEQDKDSSIEEKEELSSERRNFFGPKQ